MLTSTNARRKCAAVNENTYDISSIKKFLEVSPCSRAKQRQRNLQKKCAARAKLLLLIRPFLVFSTFSGVAFAAFHHTILYFFWTNYKYYRELPFYPWLNLCIIYNNKNTLLSIANLIASRHIMRGKRPHFRLTCVAQKRFCLTSSL